MTKCWKLTRAWACSSLKVWAGLARLGLVTNLNPSQAGSNLGLKKKFWLNAPCSLPTSLPPFSNLLNCFQPLSTVFNCFQPFLNVFNRFQIFSNIFYRCIGATIRTRWEIQGLPYTEENSILYQTINFFFWPYSSTFYQNLVGTKNK